MTNDNFSNPFQITTPESLKADEVAKLFVDVFTDFYQIINPGNVIIKGPRGVGKSMMLRYLQPDCQCLKNNKKISELDYISIYVPLKDTNFKIAELSFFDNNHAGNLFNEHLMITHCLLKMLRCLKDNVDSSIDIDRLKTFYRKDFLYILDLENDIEYESLGSSDLFDLMLRKVNEVYKSTIDYITQCSINEKILPYSGHLYDYNYFFIPLVECLSNSISDDGITFYLLLDDAHFLSLSQTRILNSWVSSRTSRKVSLKISTQYNYKTYYTVNGATIDTPHDYLEVDMATVYTEGSKTNKSKYYKRIHDIVEKRLKLFGIDTEVENFFPYDEKQEAKIKGIEQEYIERFDKGQGRGTNRTDDARRYARPDYIKSLAGTSKNSHTYSYSGFDQLVNISSGVVRFFLQQSYSMFAEQVSKNDKNQTINSISPTIQNEVIRKAASEALFFELDAYAQEGHVDSYPKEDIEKLSNLIKGLGGLFRRILLSNRSERRVFSIAVSDELSESVKYILNIGIDLGYLHVSTIGRKNAGSIGRTKLYVLNRRLAPIWTLDPNGFAGYLFLQNSVLERAIKNPYQMVENINIGTDIEEDTVQLSLFDSDLEVYESENE